MNSVAQHPIADRADGADGSLRHVHIQRPGPAGTARWAAVVGAAQLAVMILDLWIVPQRTFPALYAVPLLVAAHHLPRRIVSFFGLLTAAAHLVALWTVGEVAVAWGLDLLALGVILCLALWVVAQREQAASRDADERRATLEWERDRLDDLVPLLR